MLRIRAALTKASGRITQVLIVVGMFPSMSLGRRIHLERREFRRKERPEFIKVAIRWQRHKVIISKLRRHLVVQSNHSSSSWWQNQCYNV
ncbi:hypothetical protein BT69DRAFT_638281 [Atractiella rhizophila]|nr:hypothetical protein BT69DRAFT_638281 [Atractiella rhizophila]